MRAVKRLRLGIVGVGRHGARYARHAARDLDEVELVAVCRRDVAAGAELARELGCDYVSDARGLIERADVDAVALVTVPHLLEELIDACIAAGKPVLVEKPVAPDLDTGNRIAHKLRHSSLPCMAGHTLRFNAVVRRIHELVPSLGRIDTIVLTQRFPPQNQLEWIDDPERSGGGNILHTGVHCFDLIRHLTGLEPQSVACTTRSICTVRTEDNFSALLTFHAHSALALVACSRSTRSRNGTIEISGENGQLVGDHVHNSLAMIGPERRTTIDVGTPAQTVLEATRAFARAVLGGTKPEPDYDDGLAAVAVANACYAAARSGGRAPVVLPDRGQ